MKVDPNSDVAGVSIRELRSFFKRNRESASAANLAAGFEHLAPDFDRFVQALQDQGYLGEKDNQDYYDVGDLGRSLANASFLARMTRPHAERLLEALVERAGEINKNGDLTHFVEQVSVFGSYITNATDLGDVDVAVKLTPRDADPKITQENSLKRAELSGRSISFIDKLFYGRNEVMKLLKSRNGRISVHEATELEELGVESVIVFER